MWGSSYLLFTLRQTSYKEQGQDQPKYLNKAVKSFNLFNPMFINCQHDIHGHSWTGTCPDTT
jgi:hypothetical protein